MNVRSKIAVVVGIALAAAAPARAQYVGMPDIVVPADYAGVGFEQLALFRPDDGTWYIQNVQCAGVTPCQAIRIQFGMTGDVPFAEDLDGDGRADLLLYRPSTGVWYLRGGSCNSRATPCDVRVIHWGGEAGDIPYIDDFDGDGGPDLMIYRPSTEVCWVLRTQCSEGAYSCYSFIPPLAPRLWSERDPAPIGR
jgi:hypothetical protein